MKALRLWISLSIALWVAILFILLFEQISSLIGLLLLVAVGINTWLLIKAKFDLEKRPFSGSATAKTPSQNTLPAPDSGGRTANPPTDQEGMPMSNEQVTVRMILVTLEGVVLMSVAIITPFVWLLRDGLGPSAVESSGLLALERAFWNVYWGPIAVTAIAFCVGSECLFWRWRYVSGSQESSMTMPE